MGQVRPAQDTQTPPQGAGALSCPGPGPEARLGGAGRWHAVAAMADGILPSPLRAVFLLTANVFVFITVTFCG